MFAILTDEQRQFIGSVRELAQREFRDRAQRHMTGVFPWDNMRALAELGRARCVKEDSGGRPVERWFATATKAI